MWFFCLVVGVMIGFCTCAILSANQYEKGFEDGFLDGWRKGDDE